MAPSRALRRRTAGVASTKIVITSLSLAATVGGWAAIGAFDHNSNNEPTAALAEGQSAQAPLSQQAPSNDQFFGRHRHAQGYPPGFGNQTGPSQNFPTQPQDMPDQSQLPEVQPQTLPDQSQTVPQQPQFQQTQPQFQQQPRFRTRSSR